MPYTKQAIIKYKKTTLSIKYYLLEGYATQLFNDGNNMFPRDYYSENKKAINKKIRTELDTRNIDKNLSQYIEYWLFYEIRGMIYDFWTKCEDRNKRQREQLKKKYSIIEKDKLLEKISCLERKIYDYKYPKESKEEIERVNEHLGLNITYEEVLNKNCE